MQTKTYRTDFNTCKCLLFISKEIWKGAPDKSDNQCLSLELDLELNFSGESNLSKILTEVLEKRCTEVSENAGISQPTLI